MDTENVTVWKGPTPFLNRTIWQDLYQVSRVRSFLSGRTHIKRYRKTAVQEHPNIFQNYKLWLEIARKIIILIYKSDNDNCYWVHPLGNDHISHQTGRWENNLLKNAGWDRGICDRSQEGICFHCITPWKINGWNIQITHKKKGKWSEPNLYDYVPAVNLPGCTLMLFFSICIFQLPSQWLFEVQSTTGSWRNVTWHHGRVSG